MQFTQLDMEMSFMDADAIMALSEQLIASVLQQVMPAYAPIRTAASWPLAMSLPSCGSECSCRAVISSQRRPTCCIAANSKCSI